MVHGKNREAPDFGKALLVEQPRARPSSLR
jgi:hypothetical protein